MSISYLIRKKDIDAVRKYIAIGGNINASESSKGLNGPFYPLLSLAILAKRTEIALLLIRSGADVNKQAAYGTTAAHLACQMNNEATLKALVEANADLSLTTVQFRYDVWINDYIDKTFWPPMTPSDIAFKYKHFDLADLLLVSGGANAFGFDRYPPTWIFDKFLQGSYEEEKLQKVIDMFGIDNLYVTFRLDNDTRNGRRINTKMVRKLIGDGANILSSGVFRFHDFFEQFLLHLTCDWPREIVDDISSFLDKDDWLGICPNKNGFQNYRCPCCQPELTGPERCMNFTLLAGDLLSLSRWKQFKSDNPPGVCQTKHMEFVFFPNSYLFCSDN